MATPLARSLAGYRVFEPAQARPPWLDIVRISSVNGDYEAAHADQIDAPSPAT